MHGHHPSHFTLISLREFEGQCSPLRRGGQKILLWQGQTQEIHAHYTRHRILKEKLQFDLEIAPPSPSPSPPPPFPLPGTRAKFLIGLHLKTGHYFGEVCLKKQREQTLTVEWTGGPYKAERRGRERLLTYPHRQVYAFFPIETETEAEEGGKARELLFLNRISPREVSMIKDFPLEHNNHLGCRVLDLSREGFSFLANRIELAYFFQEDFLISEIILNFENDRYNLSQGRVLYHVDYLYPKAKEVPMYKVGMVFQASREFSAAIERYHLDPFAPLETGKTGKMGRVGKKKKELRLFEQFLSKLPQLCLPFLLVALVVSCAQRVKKTPISQTQTQTQTQTRTRNQAQFYLIDKSGHYLVKRERGYDKKRKGLVVKNRIFSIGGGEQKKLLEKSIAISRPGTLKFKNSRGKVSILRPQISQYTVWLEGEKYFSEIKLNEKARGLDVRLIAPEGHSKGRETKTVVPFPKGNGVYCFFSQLIECIKATSFITQALEKEVGNMSFFIIWDGHPYFQEQYENLPSHLFSFATLEYDGKNREGESRFTLQVAGQSIFYFLDSQGELRKQFWVSQGMSMVKSDIIQ